MESRPIWQIAEEIRRDWKRIPWPAEDCLRGMDYLEHMGDMVGADSAYSVIAHFLGNASTWKGEIARKIKKELNAMLTALPERRPGN